MDDEVVVLKKTCLDPSWWPGRPIIWTHHARQRADDRALAVEETVEKCYCVYETHDDSFVAEVSFPSGARARLVGRAEFRGDQILFQACTILPDKRRKYREARRFAKQNERQVRGRRIRNHVIDGAQARLYRQGIGDTTDIEENEDAVVTTD